MAEFDDGKDENALRTIGEVSEALEIKPHVLRYWEQQFSLLKPLKRSGGRRYYRLDDVKLVEEIDRLVNQEGYTLKGAEAVLRARSKSELDRRSGEDRRKGDRRANEGANPDTHVTVETLKPDHSETIAALKAVRDRLAKAIKA
ncbi:MAG: MerR family transcriptional regulator [Erythrobacter sp.]|uniref:MerR family transcriptional regulator n=1 Tax=Erythrobacter sp. TaxID=1042 RepID=UPI002634DEC5|nr:MerR family transcriptional regulator [Erythrobacter sp.]MDJ0978827.1 MerR family transcriptional regulator [Erythrobacter sp.]